MEQFDKHLTRTQIAAIDRKSHKKMYKAGKGWVVAGMATAAVALGAGMTGAVSSHAADATPTTTTPATTYNLTTDNPMTSLTGLTLQDFRHFLNESATFVDEDGKTLSPRVVHTGVFERTATYKNGKIAFNAWTYVSGSLDDIIAPEIPGYDRPTAYKFGSNKHDPNNVFDTTVAFEAHPTVFVYTKSKTVAKPTTPVKTPTVTTPTPAKSTSAHATAEDPKTSVTGLTARDLRHVVNEDFRSQDANGTSLAPLVSHTGTFEREADYKDGKITYTPWKYVSGDLTDVTAPTIENYTLTSASKLPSEISDATHTFSTKTLSERRQYKFVYTKQATPVVTTPVKTPVKTTPVVTTPTPAKPTSWHATADNPNTAVSGLTEKDLKHDLTEAFTFVYENGKQASAPITHKGVFTREASYDATTGKITYTPWKYASGDLADVTAPDIAGFTTDVKHYLSRVNYQNDFDPAVINEAHSYEFKYTAIPDAPTKPTTTTDTPTTTTTPDTPTTPAKPTSWHATADNPNTAVSGLTEQDLKHDLTETFTFVYENGKQASAPITHKGVFTREASYDATTGKITYTPWKYISGDLIDVDAPDIAGFTTDVKHYLSRVDYQNNFDSKITNETHSYEFKYTAIPDTPTKPVTTPATPTPAVTTPVHATVDDPKTDITGLTEQDLKHTVNETFTFVDENGKQMFAPISNSGVFTREATYINGVVEFTPWKYVSGNLTDITAPDKDGYTHANKIYLSRADFDDPNSGFNTNQPSESHSFKFVYAKTTAKTVTLTEKMIDKDTGAELNPGILSSIPAVHTITEIDGHYSIHAFLPRTFTVDGVTYNLVIGQHLPSAVGGISVGDPFTKNPNFGEITEFELNFDGVADGSSITVPYYYKKAAPIPVQNGWGYDVKAKFFDADTKAELNIDDVIKNLKTPVYDTLEAKEGRYVGTATVPETITVGGKTYKLVAGQTLPGELGGATGTIGANTLYGTAGSFALSVDVNSRDKVINLPFYYKEVKTDATTPSTDTPTAGKTATSDPEVKVQTGTPVSTTPTTDKPSTDTPSTGKTATTDPEVKVQTGTPISTTPTTDKPSTDTPSTDKPSTDKPSTDKPSTDKPSTDKPSTDKPSTDKPSTDKPSTDKPSTDKPSTTTPVTTTPVTTTPVTTTPVTTTPVTTTPETPLLPATEGATTTPATTTPVVTTTTGTETGDNTDTPDEAVLPDTFGSTDAATTTSGSTAGTTSTSATTRTTTSTTAARALPQTGDDSTTLLKVVGLVALASVGLFALALGSKRRA